MNNSEYTPEDLDQSIFEIMRKIERMASHLPKRDRIRVRVAYAERLLGNINAEITNRNLFGDIAEREYPEVVVRSEKLLVGLESICDVTAKQNQQDTERYIALTADCD